MAKSNFIWGTVALVLLIFVFAWKDNLKSFFEFENRGCEGLNDLIGGKVYTNHGHYIGRVKDIVLEDSKIDSLKIKLSKKLVQKNKRISLKYSAVVNVFHVVIIKEGVLDNLLTLKEEVERSKKLNKGVYTQGLKREE